MWFSKKASSGWSSCKSSEVWPDLIYWLPKVPEVPGGPPRWQRIYIHCECWLCGTRAFRRSMQVFGSKRKGILRHHIQSGQARLCSGSVSRFEEAFGPPTATRDWEQTRISCQVLSIRPEAPEGTNHQIPDCMPSPAGHRHKTTSTQLPYVLSSARTMRKPISATSTRRNT